jgi:hypothetical protein
MTPYRLRYCSLVLILSAALPAMGQAQQGAGCRTDSTYAALDFWLGQWDVYVGDQLVGTNRITRVLQGCAVLEEWRDSEGGEGRSLFYVEPGTGRWKQVWITDDARRVGGTKEKHLVARLPDGGIRFQGELPLPDGRLVLDRTTLTPTGPGEVRQLIETSRDGGTTWHAGFDARYRKHG